MYIEEYMKTFIRPFDLGKPQLMRASLLRIHQDQYVILTDMHHIIGDGVSSVVLENEFQKMYSGERLAPLRIQYKDYAVWQSKQLHSDGMKQQQDFWLKQFAGEIPVLDLATDYPRPLVQQFEGARIAFQTDVRLTNELNELASGLGVTLNMLLLAGYKIMLHLYSGQEDIVVGMPTSGRSHADLEKIVGMFINTLPIRSYPTRQSTVREFVEAVKTMTLQAFDNQDYPFEELVKQVVSSRDPKRGPLFDTMFVVQNYTEFAKESLPDNLGLSFEVSTAKFDLTLTAIEADGAINFDMEYATKLFKKSTVMTMSQHFIHVLEQMVANPKQRLEEMEITTSEEKQFLAALNDTQTNYPRSKSLSELFEEQAVRTPGHTAVRFGEYELTYLELNQKANQMARMLQDQGVSKGEIVAIMIDRSLEMIIGIIGILKAGAAYLPMDPEYPKERVKYMLEDSRPDYC